MDIVYLHGLKCECNIGVWNWEKLVAQTLVLDIDVAADVAKVAADDNLEHAIDYQAIAERVQAYASEHRFALIETLAERLAALVLGEFNTTWVRIKVDKGQAVKGTKNVGVIIERGDKPR